MSKNYADIYNSVNDSIALAQRWYVKQETTRGTFVAPTGADFIYTLTGGQVEFMQPFESSPHRSGRHHNNIIKKKKETNWSFPTFFNIDTTLGSAAAAEIDPGMKVLWKSLLGGEDLSAGAKYTPTTPDITFSLFEVGDKFSRQCRAAFVQASNVTLPGDGEAKAEWSGNAKDALYVGMGKSVSANAANTVTLISGDGGQFKAAVGGLVMIIKANGTTRSTDTPDGSPRTIVSVTGDDVVLSGAVLTDADGTGMSAPVYLVYYEPTTPVAIDNPITGLVGSFAIAGYTGLHCARSISFAMKNDHELVNYCYGTDSLDAPYFVPGSRFTCEPSFEMNMNKDLMAFFHGVESFDSQALTAVLGAASGRRLEMVLPRAFFPVPSFSVPDTGSVPVTFKGTAYQTTLDAGDEFYAWFK